MSDAKYLVLSFPRSGNHLVRSLIEFSFRRPTLGCPGASRDTPIHERPANRESGLISIDDPEPLALKAHTLNCIWQHRKAFPGPMRTIFLQRDPVAAISSQLLRKRGLEILGERRLRRALNEQVNMYLQGIYYFRQVPEADRLLIRFEDLVHAERGPDCARRILGFMGFDGTFDAARWPTIAGLAKSSQSSLGQVSERRRARINAAVSAVMTGAEIEAILPPDAASHG